MLSSLADDKSGLADDKSGFADDTAKIHHGDTRVEWVYLSHLDANI
jgi:hypothetical protein